MNIKLHKNATTTPRIRALIQATANDAPPAPAHPSGTPRYFRVGTLRVSHATKPPGTVKPA